MKEFIIRGYSYNELGAEAKEKVKQWYLEMDFRSDFLYEDYISILNEDFPHSELDVQFSLSYCQGDGVNIFGELNLVDFIEGWTDNENEKQEMLSYIKKSKPSYIFTENKNYCYSCKHIDRKEIDYLLYEIVNDLTAQNITFNYDLIKRFFTDLFNYFEKLDFLFENKGYDYLYNPVEDEIQDFCDGNDYYFDENGNFIG